jgi:hypothetical protein
MQSAYRNLGYVLLILPLVLIAGFWIPYFSEIPKFEPSITTAVHVHALLLFAWVALLVIQPLAIRSNSFSIHRMLGKASYILMPLVLFFAIAMLRKEYGCHGHSKARCGRAHALHDLHRARAATRGFGENARVLVPRQPRFISNCFPRSDRSLPDLSDHF